MLRFITAVIILLLCAVGWYFWGVELDIASAPGAAAVVLDGKRLGSTPEQGPLALPHLPHGKHTLTLTHPGFDSAVLPISLGWFEMSHSVQAKLAVPSFPLTVLTNPGGAKVQLDGNEVGSSDESGNLVVPNVARGQHVVTVTLEGYPSWSNSFSIEAPFTVRAFLAAAGLGLTTQGAEASSPNTQVAPPPRAPSASSNASEVNRWLSRAEAQFEQGDYRGAIQSCDAVLSLDPSDDKAKQLKAKVENTMRILGK